VPLLPTGYAILLLNHGFGFLLGLPRLRNRWGCYAALCQRTIVLLLRSRRNSEAMMRTRESFPLPLLDWRGERRTTICELRTLLRWPSHPVHYDEPAFAIVKR
jgi:hypothetical protein